MQKSLGMFVPRSRRSSITKEERNRTGPAYSGSPAKGRITVPLDPTVQEYVTRIQALHAPALRTLTPEQAREGFVASQKLLQAAAPMTPNILTEDLMIPGPYGEIPVRVYASAHQEAVPLVLFFHGGGFVLGDIESYDHVARALQAASSAVVISVGYHRPPEFKFPKPVDECFAALHWVMRHATDWNTDPHCLFVSGDSAGGNLAAVVAQKARHDGITLRGQILFYPTTDMLAVTASKQIFGTQYLLQNDDMAWFGEMYLRTVEDALLPEASPARLPNLAGLSPTFIATAEYDPLRDEAEDYAHALQAQGVDVWLRRYEGVIHGFVSVPFFAQASAVMRDAARFIQQHCAPS
ncbi:hypothetical protein CO251_07360 [Sulfobacillus sp. hq2]|nr:hypothetical protein CO251_07360 [Sulfobacillus sp. hq2]